MALQIKEHGIYERRDGKISGPICRVNMGAYKWRDKNNAWLEDGRFSDVPGGTGLDLVREIVVGPGWMPWNGGENPAPGRRIAFVMRDGEIVNDGVADLCLWDNTGKHSDILAYRIVEEGAEPAKEDEKEPVIELQFFRERAMTKLRADLPDHISINKADNGGFIVVRSDYLEYGRPKVIAALSNDADLLAWLTEQPA